MTLIERRDDLGKKFVEEVFECQSQDPGEETDAGRETTSEGTADQFTDSAPDAERGMPLPYWVEPEQ